MHWKGRYVLKRGERSLLIAKDKSFMREGIISVIKKAFNYEKGRILRRRPWTAYVRPRAVRYP